MGSEQRSDAPWVFPKSNPRRRIGNHAEHGRVALQDGLKAVGLRPNLLEYLWKIGAASKSGGEASRAPCPFYTPSKTGEALRHDDQAQADIVLDFVEVFRRLLRP
ncbi:MAG: hypothetical protein V4550_09180 [Gemmatimonadota bacterium]